MMKTDPLANSQFPKSNLRLRLLPMGGVALLLSLGGALTLEAADVTLTLSDGFGLTSFNTALNWSDSAAPSAGKSYYVSGGRTLRTPADSSNPTFSGAALVLGDGPTVGTLALKNTGVNTITIGDLRMDNGSVGQGDTNTKILAGNISILNGGGSFDAGASGRTMSITANISGSGNVSFLNSGGVGDGILILGGSNSYTGTTSIASNTLVRLNSANALGATAATQMTGGKLDLNNRNASVGALSGSSSASIYSGTAGAVKITSSFTSGTSTFSGTISDGSGTVSLEKGGAGNLVLDGANTYSGTTLVSGGVLSLNDGNSTTARLANTTQITINNTGTLLLSQSVITSTNRINDTASLILSGGTFDTNGLSEGTSLLAGIGALTLQDNSIIDLGSGASIVHFADSSSAIWTGGKTLSIYNWSGIPTGGGTDAIYFGLNSSGLISGQLDQISFYSDNGASFIGTGQILSTGEIIAVPEPSASLLVGVGLFLAFIVFRRKSERTS